MTLAPWRRFAALGPILWMAAVSGAAVTSDQVADHLLGISEISGEAFAEADSDGNGRIDSADVVDNINAVTLPGGVVLGQLPAGSFEMGDPFNEGNPNERPVHTVALSPYEIGVCEVTNAQFCRYLNHALGAGEIVTSGGLIRLNTAANTILAATTTSPGDPTSQIIYNGFAFSPRPRDTSSNANHPVIHVSWYGAAAYCNWLSRQATLQEVYTQSGTWPGDLSRSGYHLPTEAQWERAAAWQPGHGHWRYGISSDAVNIFQANHSLANPAGFLTYPYTSPVGHYLTSVSPAGCFDMSGNVEEWCHDWFGPNYYQTSPAADPPGPNGDGFSIIYRVLRGGMWGSDPGNIRTTYRWYDHASSRADKYGFRVARNL